MYSQEIERLARYLIGTSAGSPDLCRFLVLDTFAKLNASAIIMMGISSDGHVVTDSSFGLPDELIGALGSFPLATETPIVAGFRSNQVASLTRSEFVEAFPHFQVGHGVPKNVVVLVLCPILPYGGFGLALNSSIDIDPELEMYFRAVGTLAALHFNRLQFENSKNVSKKVKSVQNGKAELTGRQKLIKKMMENGHTNGAIANEIGYSESLVKQEAMAIFSILKIDGRKELVRSSGYGEFDDSNGEGDVLR